MFTEDGGPHKNSAGGYSKDAAEVEGYVRGFARRRPDVGVSILRMAQLIGPTVDTALTRYLRLPVVPTLAGYDPRLQLLHETDAVEVLRLATVSDRPGVVNVAGDGVVSLAQLVRRAGRVRVPVPGPGRWAWPARSPATPARASWPPRRPTCCATAGSSTPPGCANGSATNRATPPRPRSPRSCVPGRPVPRLGLAAVGVGSDVLQARGVRARRAVTGA